MSESRTTDQIAACSRSLLDRALAAPGALAVCVSTDRGETRGAWSSAKGAARGGGGGAISLGPGSVYVALILERASSVVPDADPERIVNRHVRPLLGALTRLGVPAMHGGRDFIASRGTPIAWVGFQHSAETGRAAFEAIVGVDHPIASEPRRQFRDRAPKSLRELGCVYDARVVAERIEAAYRAAYPDLAVDLAFVGEADVANGGSGEDSERSSEGDEVPTRPVIQVEVGVVGARRGPDGIDVYGDFYASREVVPRLREGLRAGLAVDACIAAALSGAVLFGLPSTEPLAQVITAARGR